MQWDISHVTQSDRDDQGYPTVQADAYGDTGGAPFYLQHQYGFYSRPHDPEPDRGWCTLFVAKDGSTRHGFLGVDPRFIQSIPLPAKGSAQMYVGFNQTGSAEDSKTAFLLLDGNDGTLQFYRPHGEDAAQSFTMGVDGDGEPTFEVRPHDGASLTYFDGKWVLKSPDGGTYVEVSNDGIVLRGNITAMGGMSPPGGVELAKAAPVAGAFSALASALDVVALSLTQSGQVDQAATVTAAVAALRAALPALPTETTRGH
jgi:hypothetical protein